MEFSVKKTLAFKSLFLTNSLDGKADYLVSDWLFSLVGPKVQEFCEKLMNEPCPKNLTELLRTITPPKGIKRKNNIEGSELFTCEGPELNLSKQEIELRELETDGKIY